MVKEDKQMTEKWFSKLFWSRLYCFSSLLPPRVEQEARLAKKHRNSDSFLVPGDRRAAGTKAR